MLKRLPLVTMILALPSSVLLGADYSLSTLDEAPPREVAEALTKSLSKTGVRVLDKKKRPFVDIWFPAEVTVPGKDHKPIEGASLTAKIPEGTFLGVIHYHKRHYDFRDQDFPAGAYSMRYAIQPQDGDHLGASETRDFVLLCSLKGDTKIEPMPTQEQVELSKKAAGRSHPASIFLVSMNEKDRADSLPALHYNEEKDWQVVHFEVKVGKAQSLRLGLIIVGVSEEA